MLTMNRVCSSDVGGIWLLIPVWRTVNTQQPYQSAVHLNRNTTCVTSVGFWQIRVLASATGLNRVSVGIDESDFAQAQFPHSSLDFGAVADHHPHETVWMDHLLSGRIQIRGFKRADSSGQRLVVIVRPSVMQQIDDRIPDRVQ